MIRTLLACILLTLLSAGAATAAPADPAQPRQRSFRIERVSAHTYAAMAMPTALVSGNVGIILCEDHLILIDSTDSPTSATRLLEQIREEVSELPVRYVINTHAHLDHGRGNAVFKAQGATIVGTLATQEELSHSPGDLEGYYSFLRTTLSRLIAEKSDDTRLLDSLRTYLATVPVERVPGPGILVDQRLVLGTKDIPIHVLHPGPAHTHGDLIVLLPSEQVVFTGDIVHGFEPLFGTVPPSEWLRTLDAVAQLDFTRVVPGHGGVQHGRRHFDLFRSYLMELNEKVQAGLDRGESLESMLADINDQSLDCMRRGGLGGLIEENWARSLHPVFRPTLASAISNNVRQVYVLLSTSGSLRP